jgi:hypothetical protein|tara:strand:- start:69 stop:263 length:195 start_codon:yes stop_codon:yes gene_type:complete
MDLLEQKLENARVRAEKAGEEYYSLVPNEQYYDSVEEQLKRRQDYIDVLESVILELLTVKKTKR